MSDEKPIAWEKNPRAQRVYDRLRLGDATTLELLRLFLVHPARQVWELRHWYGKTINTHRQPNGIAEYELVGA